MTLGGNTNMDNLTPEQATFLMQRAVQNVQNEHAITKKIIEAIPLDKGDYRPDAVSMTAFGLASHIAIVENLFLNGVATGEFDFTAKMPDSIRNSADLAKWYDETFQKSTAAIKALSPAQLTKVIDFKGKFQWPAVEYVPFASSHTIHHRGQLSTYLRPMGAKVPSMYGESYDDAQARKAAQA
jgi:uncharacterized damage-inducible protein DinB